MNYNRLVIAAISILSLVILLYTVPSSSAKFLIAQVQQQAQVITHQIDAASLKRPYWLSIKTTNSTLMKGKITLNGKVIYSLTQSKTRFDLAPYLKVGKNTIIISGNYYPVNASVMIELINKDSHIKQQTSGNSLLNQILIIEVN
jgi:type II secretory pathway pseudopilin PulG